MKRESMKVPWKLSLAKKYGPALKERFTKTEYISLVIIRFFFSQTNLVFIDILDRFCHSLFTFLPFGFWYGFLIFYEVHPVPLCLLLKPVKFSVSKCSYVLFSVKHSYLLTTEITPDVDNSMLLCYYMLCKSCIVLCMLDATFYVWLWPQLNWSSMYMPGHFFVTKMSIGI